MHINFDAFCKVLTYRNNSCHSLEIVRYICYPLEYPHCVYTFSVWAVPFDTQFYLLHGCHNAGFLSPQISITWCVGSSRMSLLFSGTISRRVLRVERVIPCPECRIGELRSFSGLTGGWDTFRADLLRFQPFFYIFTFILTAGRSLGILAIIYTALSRHSIPTVTLALYSALPISSTRILSVASLSRRTTAVSSPPRKPEKNGYIVHQP
jgi:hypothetical protein